MKLQYIIKVASRDSLGTPSPLIEPENISMDFYRNNIPLTSFSALSLIRLELSALTGEEAIMRVFHLWTSGKPKGYCIVCSPRFKSVLEQLYLPPHRFYPAIIEAEGIQHHYFVLHYLHQWKNDIDYSQSTFAEAEIMRFSPATKHYTQGFIQSSTQLAQLEQQAIAAEQWIFPTRLTFQPGKLFDVWNLFGQHIVSEKARNMIIDAGLTGIELQPLKDSEMKEIEIDVAGNVS